MTSARVRVTVLWLADMLSMSLSWLVVVKLYRVFGSGVYQTTAYLNVWPILLVFTILNACFRLYHGNVVYPSLSLSPVEEFRRLTGSILISHILVMAVLGFAHATELISRFVLIVSGILTILIVQPVRNLFRRILFKLGVGQIRAVMVGDGTTAKNVAEELANNAFCGVRLVGYFGKAEGAEVMGLKRLGGIRDVVRVSQSMDVKILFSCEDVRLFRNQLVDFTTWFQHMEFIPIASYFPVSGARPISLGGIGGMEMTNQMRMKAMGWSKGLLDKCLSVIAFVMLLPLYVVIPILIKLTSKGPVFFLHERLGKNGRTFKIWKFRTMYADAAERLEHLLEENPELKAEWEANHKLKNDPRVTPFGKFLRVTSLDEVPQFINVFKGEMSLVGPRPIVEKEVHHYGEHYEVFSRIRPGITGLWQCLGRSDTSYARRVALDVYYAFNWSPWLDIWICLRTVFSILTMKGAM